MVGFADRVWLELRGGLRDRVDRWSSIARLLPAGGGWTVAAGIVLNILLGLLPIVFMVAAAALVGGAIDREGQPSLAVPFATAIVAFALHQALSPLQYALGELIARRVDRACIGRLLTTSTVTAPVPLMEEPAVLNVVGDARDAIDRDYETPGGAVAGALALIARYGTLAGAVVALFVVMPPMAALAVGVAALVVRFGQRGSLGRFGDVWDGLAGPRRKANYLRDLSSGTAIAKEARILGIARWLIGRYRKDSQAYLISLWAGRRRILLRPFLGFAMAALIGSTIGGIALVRGTATGSISALELAVGLQALLIAARFGVFFPESDVRTQYGLQAYQALTTFERRARQAASPPAGRGGSRVEPGLIEQRKGESIPGPVQLSSAIRLVDVSFRYRTSSAPVLDELNLEVPAGKTTAIVGLNGSGKTTVVKLLTRLRAPDGGRIVWDDEDCREVDLVAWQRRFAVLSQDYGRFEMSVAENVAMGAPEHLADREGILASIERAGIGDYIRRLPHGVETLVARQYVNGTDLSGGQWQRLALARVLFAVEHGASILVLDEPTAHLDIRAEAEFFDRFLALADGVTNILISHRFATVRRADHILVLQDGRISERGSHTELMEHDGLYAELFRLQARMFGDEVRVEAAT